jgi:hypothetical protein
MASASRVIPAPRNTEEDSFVVGESLTVFEAAMVYAGRHPHSRFLNGGSIDDHIEFLKAGIRDEPSRKRIRARRSWDIYCEIVDRIKGGRIQPVRRAYDEKGQSDPTRTVIHITDVCQLATERDERPKYLSRLQLDKQASQLPPFTKLMAERFVREHVDAERKAGRHPTMRAIEAAARNEGRRGGREFIRTAARRLLGPDAKRGRPKTKIAKK